MPTAGVLTRLSREEPLRAHRNSCDRQQGERTAGGRASGRCQGYPSGHITCTGFVSRSQYCALHRESKGCFNTHNATPLRSHLLNNGLEGVMRLLFILTSEVPTDPR